MYIDLDALQGGMDWTDELNAGITNCQGFVPIISPTYAVKFGKRACWTAREFKLADGLNRCIIPLYRSGTYPPTALQLQMGALQFIDCRIGEDRYMQGTELFPFKAKGPETFETQMEQLATRLMESGVQPTEKHPVGIPAGNAMVHGTATVHPE